MPTGNEVPVVLSASVTQAPGVTVSLLALPTQRQAVEYWPLSARDGRGAFDFLLQLQHSVDQRFCGWRAARHLDINRHNAITSTHHCIGIVVIPATIGARPHGQDPARLWHLVINPTQGGRHLVGQGAGHDHHV